MQKKEEKKPWQDRVMLAGGFLFSLMLIPMAMDAYNGVDINIWTSGPTIIGLSIYAVCFWTLKLKLATIAEILTIIMWGIIFAYGL